MHERMLNKQETPMFDDLIRYCGDNGKLWAVLDEHLKSDCRLTTQIRFPYGKEYGWAVKYSKGSKHICDIFAENGAFAALFQVSDNAIEPIYDQLGEYAKNVWNDKSPCNSGGWIEFRVQNDEQLQDLTKIIHAKIGLK